MAKLIDRKFMAEIDEPVVVFLIGGHSNNILAVRQWSWVAFSFIRMIRYLTTHPETGCLGGHTYYRSFPFGMLFLSYWRSFDDLEHFARSKDEAHIKAWGRFIRETLNTKTMAIWHETYLIEPGKFEAVYGSSVPYGLSAVARIAYPTGRDHNARGRINPQDETVSSDPLIPMPPDK